MVQPDISEESTTCPNLNEPCTAMDVSGGRTAGSEHTRPRRGTDETIDPTSTFVGSEKSVKEIDIQTLELQPGAGDSLALHLSPTAVEEGRPTQERVPFGRWQRFRLHWLTSYRILIMFVIMINLGAMIATLVKIPMVEAPLTATATNILAAVLVRQEDLINLSFGLISRLPPTLPFSIRRTIGDFHHYGGVHVGCALSAVLWYIMFTGLNTVRVLDLLSQDDTTTTLYIEITISYITLFIVLLICLTAIPRLRVRFHNTFEATHRFGGWAALLILWLHAGITTLDPTSTPLHTHPSLYLLALTTLLILLPWLRIHRIPITTTLLSPQTLALTFPSPNTPHTSTLRFSTTPLTEWHAFATIPLTPSTAQIFVSAAGDWTRDLLTNPPSTLWLRNPPTRNFLSLVPLFKDVLLVATGAGIAPVLSLLASPPVRRMRAQGRRVRVLWCVSDPWAPRWGFVMDVVRAVDPKAVMVDSRVGRMDLVFEARGLCEREGLEAVFVVGNRWVTGEVVRGCKGRGVLAYGAVFDS